MRRILAALSLIGCTPSPTPAATADPPPAHQPATAQAEPAHQPATAPEEPAQEEPAQEEPAATICDVTAHAAARTSLEAAQAGGVSGEFLEDCAVETTQCGLPRAPIPTLETCQIIAYAHDSRWEVVVVPRPATGAPTRFEIWTELDGSQPGRKQISGSTWGVAATARIRGLEGYASHTHGGDAATIDGADFEVENLAREPITLTLKRTRWLRAFSCELPREQRASPKPAGAAIDDGPIDGTLSVTIPAGATTTVSIGHERQSAYMASCDRFATAATFEVDGAKIEVIEVIAEHRVTRREPLRQR